MFLGVPEEGGADFNNKNVVLKTESFLFVFRVEQCGERSQQQMMNIMIGNSGDIKKMCASFRPVNIVILFKVN